VFTARCGQGYLNITGLEEWAYVCEEMENRSFGQSRMGVTREEQANLRGL
jgi:hypothetical protein